MQSGLSSAARRNLFLLACCQALGQSVNTMVISATAISVVTFYPVRELATLPVTFQHFGVMLSVFPASLLMQRMGRRFGFRLGSVFGMAGATVAGLGLYSANFILMCIGGLILGYAVASLQMYRFAAVELVGPSYHARAISWVTAGGVISGVLGPSLVRWTHDQWVPLYIATYATMVCVHAAVFTIMSFIRFPSPEETLTRLGAPSTPGVALPAPRPLLEIAAQPRFVAAVVAAMISFGMMSFLMGASPLAIVACGLPHAAAHWVISLHVLGMFVPSFFTGRLITRYGTANVMLAGVAIMLAGIAVALLGISEWNFRIALTLNGIGWNFLFIGATTLVTTCYRPNERGKVQALNDFLIFGTTTSASFLAGLLYERLGWYPLNWYSIPLVGIALLATGWLRLRREREPA